MNLSRKVRRTFGGSHLVSEAVDLSCFPFSRLVSFSLRRHSSRPSSRPGTASLGIFFDTTLSTLSRISPNLCRLIFTTNLSPPHLSTSPNNPSHLRSPDPQNLFSHPQGCLHPLSSCFPSSSTSQRTSRHPRRSYLGGDGSRGRDSSEGGRVGRNKGIGPDA